MQPFHMPPYRDSRLEQTLLTVGPCLTITVSTGGGERGQLHRQAGSHTLPSFPELQPAAT